MTTQNAPSLATFELIAVKVDPYGQERHRVVATFDSEQEARDYVSATSVTSPTRGRALPRGSFKDGSVLEGARHAVVRPCALGAVPHNPTA
jgi:hypothetical protein